MTSKASINITGSLESVGGPVPYSSRAGQPTAQSGQGVAPVSRSRARANGKAKRTKGISGRSSTGSLQPAALPSCSESKSVQPTPDTGWELLPQTSDERAMRASTATFQPPRLEPHTSDSVSTGRRSKRTTRTCTVCNVEKPLAEFQRNSRGFYWRRCKTCISIIKRKQYDLGKVRDWTKRNRAQVLVNAAKHRAKLKGMEFDIEASDFSEIIADGVCQVTGIPFHLDGGRTWDSPSLDRINPSKGYIKGNCRIVLYCVNVMANIWGENKIMEIAKAIMQQRRSTSETFQERLTEALRQRLSMYYSPEYVVKWKNVKTPDGRVIPSLRAKAQPLLGNWATPTAHDSGHGGGRSDASAAKRSSRCLQREARLSGWETPQALSFADSHQPGTNRQMETTESLIRGPTSSSSPAGMGNCGAPALNPSFSRWLMGYPQGTSIPGWDSCAPGWESWVTIQRLLREYWQRANAAASAASAATVTV